MKQIHSFCFLLISIVRDYARRNRLPLFIFLLLFPIYRSDLVSFLKVLRNGEISAFNYVSAIDFIIDTLQRDVKSLLSADNLIDGEMVVESSRVRCAFVARFRKRFDSLDLPETLSKIAHAYVIPVKFSFSTFAQQHISSPLASIERCASIVAALSRKFTPFSGKS